MDAIPSIKSKNLKTQIVVIGAGGGGLAAALTAIENGVKDIVVLEKRINVGGHSARANGIFACGSPVQERQGIKTDGDEFFRKFMRWTHWSRINPRIVRAYINKSGDTIRWLEKEGLDFILIPGLHPDQPPTGHWPAKGPEGKNVARLIKVLEKNFKAMGGQVFLNTTCTKILRGRNGRVAGVEATGKDGKYQIKAECVIVASGGFAANKDLLKKYCPEYSEGLHFDKNSVTTNIGDGLLMASNNGAALGDAISLLKGGPHPDITPIGAAGGIIGNPNTVWVNQKGKRFIDEGSSNMMFESVNAILLQPDSVMYSLFDNTIRQQAEEAVLGVQVIHGSQIPTEKGLYGQAEQAGSAVKISDSWDDIAAWMGAEPKVLKDTINEYNSFCKKGYDNDFIKDKTYLRPICNPPYYAVRGVTSIIDTLGGIKTNEHMECLDIKGSPIHGLYAAGVIVDGFEGETYCADLPGSACGFAINSGCIAGENSATFVLKK
jgi:fumarate reductase flavoprotein subunit